MPPDIARISHILEAALYVQDLDRARRFYQDLFGFDALLTDDRMCALAVPGRQVLLLFRQGGSHQPSRTPYGNIPPHNARGRQHLCFAVPLESLPAWEARLAERGIAIESRLVWPQNAVSIYFRDPDGHSLELSTPGLWRNDVA
jgi:catechol 2,3-dioxygenase-like lactoylglutathione lyase family enzyme